MFHIQAETDKLCREVIPPLMMAPSEARIDMDIDIRDRMMKGLDIVKPDWWIVFATQQELIDCVRSCTDIYSGTVQGKNKLRCAVLYRMWDILRGAYEAEIIAMLIDAKAETA